MNNTSINQSKYKNSKVSFDISQINGQPANYSEKDSMQSTFGLGTKFSYTDSKSQAYLNKTKSKPVIDKGNFHSSKYALPIVETEVTQVVEGIWKGNREVITNLNATQSSSISQRKMEKVQDQQRLGQKLAKSRVQYLAEAQSYLSIYKMEDITIASTNQYNESIINYINQARDNMENAEYKHLTLLDENIALKKQIQLMNEGIQLQNIRFKYYIQTAYNSLRNDSIFMLDQRIFHLLAKNLIAELEPSKFSFNSKVIASFDAIAGKVAANSKSLQNLIMDNETILKFLDHDLQLDHFSEHLTPETLEQIVNQEKDQQEIIIQALHSTISEKIIEIEKYRIADNNSRQMINTLSAKSEEYERHLQNILGNLDKEPLKNNLKRILEMKKENDCLLIENETLKKINEQHEESQANLQNENSLLAEKLNIYCKKLVQMLLDTNMNEESVKNEMENLLQSGNVDFFLKKRNMEFIKEKYSENNDTKKMNVKQEQDIENLQQQVELANQTIDQLEKKLIDSSKISKTANVIKIPTIVNLDDTSQLQHTIQQLSLILLSKDNAVQIDQMTQNLIKQMFSENFDKMIDFQQENIDNLKAKLNETEQKLYQSEAKRIEYLNMSFYLSNLLTELCDTEKESKIRGRLQKERSQIITFYGKSVQDFQDLLKQSNPRNVMQINQWYENKLKEKKKGYDEDGNHFKGGEENIKSFDENTFSDLTVLQSMGVKPLQEYISMRIGKVQEENNQLKQKIANIKQENVTVAELKRQRLQDEERYERLSKKLQAFCQDNIFTASENNDLIGHLNENCLLSIFIQANTIEEMINKTLEQDEDDQSQRASLSGSTNQENGQRDSDVRANQPAILNHSVIEEKPGEEDEYIESGKKGKIVKSYKNLSNSHHSSQNDATHQREGSGQGFDQKIMINISITSPDKSQQSSFNGQIQPMIDTQAQSYPQYIEDQNQYQQKLPILPSRHQADEHNQQFTEQKIYRTFETDAASSSKSYKNSSSSLENLKNIQMNEQQNQYQLQQQQQQQNQYKQNQYQSQIPSFKNTQKPINPQNVAQISMQQNQNIYHHNLRQSEDEAENNDEFEPRQSKPSQYIQQEQREVKPASEQHKSSKGSIYKTQEQTGDHQSSFNNNSQQEEQQRQIQIQRQKEIQDLKRFSAYIPTKQLIDPSFERRQSESQSSNFNTSNTNQNYLKPSTQPNYQSQQAQLNQSSQHRSLHSISQDHQKFFQENIGQLSDIKPSSNKRIDDDNKASFSEDQFDIFLGQRNNLSIDNPYENAGEQEEQDNFGDQTNLKHQLHHFHNQKQAQIQQQYDQEAEENQSGYKNYEPDYDEDEQNQEENDGDEEDQDQSNTFQNDEDLEEHDDSLIQEAPYFNQK